MAYTGRSDVAASLDRQLYYFDEEDDEEAVTYQQHEQQQQYHPQAAQFLQQQRRQQQQQSPAEACLRQPQLQQQQQQHGLAAVLAGPVDVSQLWEAAPAASLEQSYEQHTYTEDDEESAYDDEEEHHQGASFISSPGEFFLEDQAFPVPRVCDKSHQELHCGAKGLLLLQQQHANQRESCKQPLSSATTTLSQHCC
jgi:hypothetical protein